MSQLTVSCVPCGSDPSNRPNTQGEDELRPYEEKGRMQMKPAISRLRESGPSGLALSGPSSYFRPPKTQEGQNYTCIRATFNQETLTVSQQRDTLSEDDIQERY